MAAYPENLSAYAQRALESRGVTVLTSTAVTDIEVGQVSLGSETIEVGAVVWAAGVAASPAAEWLGADRDHAGRVKVEADLSLAGRPEVFVIGDTAAALREDGKPVPGIAPAAKQMGRYIGGLIASRIAGRNGFLRSITAIKATLPRSAERPQW